jgi:hypothetical protein
MAEAMTDLMEYPVSKGRKARTYANESAPPGSDALSWIPGPVSFSR